MGDVAENLTATQIVIFSVILLVISLAVAIVCSNLMCDLAEDKGYDPKKRHIFVICFFLGVFGWIYTIALPDLYKREYLKKISNSNFEEDKNSQKAENSDK